MDNPSHTEKRSASLSIGDLCQRAGVTRRRVRYYIQRGLLPRPHGQGRGARYSDEHVYRLEQIKPLADQGMSARLIDAARVLRPSARRLEFSREAAPDTLARQQVAGFIQILIERQASPLSLSQERQLLIELRGHCEEFLTAASVAKLPRAGG